MRRKKIREKILLGFLLISVASVAQERLGLKLGEFAGVNGVHLNPASMSGSRYYLDVNLAGGGLFINNNYLFLHQDDYSPLTFLTQSAPYPTFIDDKGRKVYLDEEYNRKLKNGYANARALGPSVMFTYGRHTFGFYTSARSLLRAKGVSYEIAKFAYEEFDYDSLFNINFINNVDMDLEMVNMAELGLSYSNIVFARNYNKVDIGVTLKYLRPHSGMKFYTENIDYIVPNRDTIIINNMNGKMKMSLPLDYDNNNYYDGGSLFKGQGLGFDVGLVYTKTREIQNRYDRFRRLCRQESVDYDYKIGVSLLDVGYVTYSQHVQTHDYDDVDAEWYGLRSFTFNNTNDFLREASYEFYGDSTISNTGKEEFTMRLPTALSASFDYHFRQSWFVNAMMVYGLPGGDEQYSRPHYAAVTPRYQSENFGLSVPVSLYDFRVPQVGFSARIYNITIGTSSLGHYLGLRQLRGSDFYFSIKFNLMKGKCGRKEVDDCRGQEYGFGINN